MNALKNLSNTPNALQMLNVAIGGLVENEICSYCKILHNDEAKAKFCNDGSFCHDFIFEGIKTYITENSEVLRD